MNNVPLAEAKNNVPEIKPAFNAMHATLKSNADPIYNTKNNNCDPCDDPNDYSQCRTPIASGASDYRNSKPTASEQKIPTTHPYSTFRDPVHPKQSKLPELSKLILSVTPSTFSIGHSNRQHREKIETIINSTIIEGTLLEENLVIISSGNATKIDMWNNKYSGAFIYSALDEDIVHFLTPKEKTIQTKKDFTKLVLFDNCLNADAIKNELLLNLFDNFKNYNYAVIIMTDDVDVISSNIYSKFDYIMFQPIPLPLLNGQHLRSGAYSVVFNIANVFDQLTDCRKTNKCLAIENKIKSTIYSFD